MYAEAWYGSTGGMALPMTVTHAASQHGKKTYRWFQLHLGDQSQNV